MLKNLISLAVSAVWISQVAYAAEGQTRTLADVQLKAKEFKATLALPTWDKSPEGVAKATDDAIAAGNKRLDAIAAIQPGERTFANTFQAIDELNFEVGYTANRIFFEKETSPDAKIRAAATKAAKKINEWAVGINYREDVYKSLKAFADTTPKLDGEDARLLEETLRDYTRAGLALPPEERKKVEGLRKELAAVGTDFETNISNAKAPIKFKKADLEGVPQSILDSKGVKTGEDEYTIDAHVTFQRIGVLENAEKEWVRKKVYIAGDTTAKTENVPLVQKMVQLRAEIARRLGYKSWDDYQIEVRMAKNGDTALTFLRDLELGLQPKFDAEKTEFAAIKKAAPGSETPDVNVWDWRYCAEQLKKQKYQVDTEFLRNYFPYQRTLEGMFGVYQTIFGIRIDPIPLKEKWVDDLQLYAVSDSATGEPLGLFYLDMFPREGKFTHFAQFGLIDGKLLPDGTYQRPTAALVCNFPPPGSDKPSLLSHGEVETLFHEFGHAMHTLLTRAKYTRFSGTNVPRDFVEAPSQMLENWVWDKEVLDTFAADYRDPSKKLPADILPKMKAAKLALQGNFYRRQLSFGITDLVLHGPQKPGETIDVVAVSNKIMSEVFYPLLPETAQVASFGHLNGYDAGYYGYAWADAIAADMATVFENAPGRFLDKDAGMRLRNEIYAQGDSRDVSISIEKFLGRPRSIQPFLKSIGIDTAKAQ
ncbi:MAG TPA: M3 family metallopeptidase [Chthoniobacterales bacterium]